MLNRNWKIRTGGLAAIALLAACSSSPSTAAASTKAITVALVAEPTGLNVHAQNNNAQRQVLWSNVVEGLTQLNSDNSEVQPALATSWASNGPTSWRFHLRQGVKFSNGEPFNADAVVANVKDLVSVGPTNELELYVSSITGATKVDDDTVDITTDKPDPILVKRMSYVMMVAPSTLSNAKWVDDPIGTGPYKFVSWTKGQQIVLERNNSYWGGAPTVAKATFIWRTDPTVRIAALQNGEADLIKDVPPDLASSLPHVVTAAGGETALIRLNSYIAPTSDVRVRQAMQMAIDIDSIIKNVFDGYAEPSQGQPLPKGAFGFDPTLQPRPYDVAAAKALIEQAGATGAKIEIVNPTGLWDKSDDALQAVAGMWKAIGLDVTVRDLEFNAWFALAQHKSGGASGPAGLFASTSNELMDADLPAQAWIQSAATYGLPPKDPQLDALILSARSELDQNKRAADYHTMFRTDLDRANLVTLYRVDFIWGIGKGWKWTPRIDDLVILKTIT